MPAFLEALRLSLANDPSSWENGDLESFLETMSAWIQGMDGYYRNMGRDVPTDPTSQMFADILNGARVCE